MVEICFVREDCALSIDVVGSAVEVKVEGVSVVVCRSVVRSATTVIKKGVIKNV